MTTLPEGWSDFFVATTGAGAALAGLIIVAMTANIKMIIGIQGMTSRAGATIGSLTLIVVAGAVALIPGQGALFVGLEILVVSVVVLGINLDSAWRVVQASRRPDYASGPPAPKIALSLAQIVPFLVGAVMLLTGDWSGLYWVAGGMIVVFMASVLNAWILLVEILR
ncbi:hypothetical protein [Agreia sp. Leaf283]|uniref:hypothetical protein n=1 Tax=Agreia sp. Leaf283 TaxID=1736321 RepID=UPI0006FE47CB|nr:hypothetical protein [Agreia sp. Leaf283]KQP56830.1 hypothetical protein ASF51_02720 [Agreia sp. Leaf283]